MKCSYHPGYQLAGPANPNQPGLITASKSQLLMERLLTEGVLESHQVVVPSPIDVATLATVHTAEYLHKLQSSTLSIAEQRRIGLPWSEGLWLRARLASEGTLLAARSALTFGLAGNLAGGSHHAFPDHGEGFCVVNDVAVAVTTLRCENHIERALIIDLDVHQGNGTAAIFESVPEVFTFSMHAERNYPAAKMRSTLDVALRDGTGDREYLDALRRHLNPVLDAAAPDIVFYLAGVDVAAGDRYGRLALTDLGIRERERAVIQAVRGRSLPLVIVLAGGYAATRQRNAELHAHVFREAVAFEAARRSKNSDSPTLSREQSGSAQAANQQP